MRDYHIQSGSMLHLLSFEDKLIYLQMPSGKVICQILRISNTVRGINLMGKDCTSPNQQQLMFSGKQLEDDLFLADCGIEYGSVVHSVFGLRSKMMISVQFPTSSTITVEVTPSSTVAEIKAKIYGLAFSSSDHQLYYGPCQLESTWSLQEYNIQENAVLQLLNPANDVCLFIHTSAEKTFALVVSRNISGSKLKKKIHKRLSIPPVDQKLFLSGKTLESESTLSGTPTVAALYVLQTEEMLIEIQSTFAKSFALVVSRFIAVCDLNLKIQQHEDCTHVSPSKQKLIFDQKVLDNDCSLSECNVTPGSTVLLLMPKDISLYIKVLSQETIFSLAAKPSNTIAEIKRRIAILLNIPMDQQRLLFEMKRLNDVCTLQECEVVDGSSLLLATYSHDKSTNSKMNVFIRNPSGEITKLAIRPNVTIPELKQQIFAENAILPSQQKLFCGSQALHGEDHLLDYEVQTNSILDVVPPGNMLVFIKPLEGNPFNLTTTPTSTVCAIKRMIRTKTGTPLHEQQITFCNQVLDENHTLLQCNVGQLSMLILLSPTEIHIYVQLLNGNIIAQSLSSRTTVGELKNVVRTKDCLLQTEILFNGHVLNNADTLAKYNVQNESILYEVRGFQAKVQLFLNSPHVKTSMLEVYPLTTILEAKTMLHELEGLPLDEQEFFLHDKQLENSFTFMDYDVQNKSTLNVQLVKPGDILLTVNTLKSTFPLTMPQTATIKDTMAKIQEEESIPLERMSLYIADKWKRLESDRTLADYNLPKVAALEVVGRCRRGVPILIKTLTGDTVRVVVTPINTVKELRDKIKKRHGISVSPLQLIHANQQLEDKKMMKEYKLLNEATVHMLEPEEMLINVCTRETKFQLIVTSSQTVTELKSKLCTLTSIQPVQQLLSISKMGSELKNEYTLLQCGIKGGTLLHLAKGIAKDGMKVTIHSSEGEKSLTVKRDQLVIELKSTIRELTYTPVHQQRVIFASQHLTDRQSLRHYNVSARCQLHVLKPDEVLIYVKVADDDNDESMVSLIVSSSITVKEVKKEFMCHHEATAKACYIAHTISDRETLYQLFFRQLVCDGRTLEDDMTLIQCNVQNESLLFLVQQLPVVEIVLETSDKAYALEVKQSAKILKFKSMIAEETGISPNQQKLVYAGQQLEDDRNLADYNIQDDSKLYVLNQNEVILFVTTPDCGTVILMVSLESNIEEVKDKIEEMLCISSDIQELVHMDVKLKDHKKLSHYCTQTCSVIYVVPAANPRISIKVETSTEKQFCIQVMDSLTIHELRECIQDKEGIPSDQQIRFTYDSQELEDDHTLNECNIREDSIVHLELAAILELVTDNSLKQSAQEECTVIEVTHSIESGEQEALYLGDSTASEYFQPVNEESRAALSVLLNTNNEKVDSDAESSPPKSDDIECEGEGSGPEKLSVNQTECESYSNGRKPSTQTNSTSSLEEEYAEEADGLPPELQRKEDEGLFLRGQVSEENGHHMFDYGVQLESNSLRPAQSVDKAFHLEETMKKETSEKSIQTVAEDLDSDKCSSQDDTELDKISRKFETRRSKHRVYGIVNSIPCLWIIISVLLLLNALQAIHLLKAKQDSMSPGSLDPKQGSSTCKRRKESFTSQDCHKLQKEEHDQFLLEVLSNSGSSEQWCDHLNIKRATCNNILYSVKEESVKILHVKNAYFDQELNPCWETIVDVLCNSLHKKVNAYKVAQQVHVDFEHVCDTYN